MYGYTIPAVVLSALVAAIFTNPTSAQTFQSWDQVEVFDPVNEEWDKCTVDQAFPGAYKVRCDMGRFLKRDIHVRKPGENAIVQSTAKAVSGPPFLKNDLVLATPNGQPGQLQMCVVLRSFMANNMGYDVDCGTGPYRVQAGWVRRDPKSP